jgi:hypothetical protein
MPTLFLHIGHMKTGTTWLQKAFVDSQKDLEPAGLFYPTTQDIDLDRKTPTGNAAGVFKSRQTFDTLMGDLPDGADLLLSSETMFDAMFDRPRLDEDLNYMLSTGFDRISVLIFVRDPISLGASIWQQYVKGWQGETRTLDTYFEESFDWPERVCRVLDRLDACPKVDVTVRNYSRVRTGLIAAVESWLDRNPGLITAPATQTLNRSFTSAEAALQVHFNRALERPTGKIFGFRLVNRLPDIPRDPPRLTRAVVQRTLERQGPFIKKVDARLPDGEALLIDLAQTFDVAKDSFVFSDAQMEQISLGIADWLAVGPENLTPSMKTPSDAQPPMTKPASARNDSLAKRLKNIAKKLPSPVRQIIRKIR